MRKFETEVQKINHEVTREITRLFIKGKFKDQINDLPHLIIKGNKARHRCCVYKERAVITERIRLAMGIEPTTGDQHSRLGDDYKHSSNNLEGPIVQVIDVACDECPINRFTVTEACRGCVAHKCMEACPKGAISFIGRQAYINQKLCIECGKCKNVCPYNAISDVMRPCRGVCPVSAVSISEDRKATIDYEKCISCGACVNACPFGAITSKSSLINVLEELTSGKNITAIIAPAFAGQFGAKVSPAQIKNALKKLGFSEVYEVAAGADLVAYNEAMEFIEKTKDNEADFMMSSCCPAFVNLVRKNYPELVANLSTIVSPMVALGRKLKNDCPDKKVVFIGPCIAKKEEIIDEELAGSIDHVLTFEEICAMLEGAEINPQDCEDSEEENASELGRCFARSGGVTQAIVNTVKELNAELDIKPVICNGIDECIKALKALKAGKFEGNFIEGMACQEGCVGGPAVLVRPNKARVLVDKYGKSAKTDTIENAKKLQNDFKVHRNYK
ncbi:MAG: ferredoxin hydrogenase large subunit [Clostridia bacterium]|jgi:[FeFe] hydrogenase (group B1/B3)|nr:hydrogenase large subunit domain protein [Clostridiales bacterium]MDK2985800.1 ferredoxin hydrogenase large subunit [Clostridia bacterium]